MKINLFVSFYQDDNKQRQSELNKCLQKNLNIGFDTVNVITENIEDADVAKKVLDEVGSHYSFYGAYSIGKRPSFNDMFDWMSREKYKDDINVLCNLDIYFDDLVPIVNIMSNTKNRNTCLALSRWDIQSDGTAKHHKYGFSQDSWIFYGSPRVRTGENYNMGVAGCDNRLAYEINKAGYDVINPSCSIKTYHLHLSNIRNYIDATGKIYRLPPPYLPVNPI